MITALFTLRQLALGIWLGSLLMLGIAVAGPIFQLSASKTLAGEINGVILGRMNTIEWICGALALLASVLIALIPAAQESTTSRLVSIVGVVITLVLLWVYSSEVTSRMTELRSTIRDFDHPRTDTEYVKAKNEFDSLHHRYTTLVSINLLLIAGEFVWGMVAIKR